MTLHFGYLQKRMSNKKLKQRQSCAKAKTKAPEGPTKTKHLCSQTVDDVLHCSAAFINEHLRQDIADVALAKRHGNSTSWQMFPCTSKKRRVTDRHTQPSEQGRCDVPRLIHLLWEAGEEWVTTKREWRREDTQKNAKSPDVDSWTEQRLNVSQQRGMEHNALVQARSL